MSENEPKMSMKEKPELLEATLTERWQELVGSCSAVAMRIQGLGSGDERNLSEAQRQALEKITDPSRRQQWLLARDCEQELRQRLSVCADGGTVLTTISHSAGLVIGLGAVAGEGPGIVKIGVDVEKSDRPLSPRVRERVVSPEELEFGLAPIEIWVIKEGSYKACFESAGTVLPDYRITAWNPSTSRGTVRLQTPKGSREKLQFSLVRESGWIVTLAFAEQFKLR